jgi:transcriptional regulator with XRE-family HTH domain
MEFNQKLQSLRKEKGITQEELAKSLYVSRTAVSKWESGRGYPSLDSLKEIAKYFCISVDELLSSNELLCVAEKEGKNRQSKLKDLTFGLLDLSVLVFFFLPLFAQRMESEVIGVCLLQLSSVASYLKVVYLVVLIITILFGAILLFLQNCQEKHWGKAKYFISISLSAVAVVIFISSLQPYSAMLSFVFLAVKVCTCFKK